MFKKNLSLAAIFICVSLTSLSTSATSITYGFTGQLLDIRQTGAGFALGDVFNATYAHDDTPQLGSIISPNRTNFSGGQLTINTANNSFTSPMTSELQVFNNYTDVNGGYLNADGFFVSSYIYDATGFYLLQFDLWDFSGTALNSLDIPSQSQLVKLAANGRLFIRRFEGGIETGLASGNFSAFSPISSIPEPETYAMMLGGLSVLGFVLRRRKFKDNI